MRASWIGNERGNVLLFVAGLLLLMLVMGGVAVDLAYYMTVDTEIQRSMDAAALAGAGNLGISADKFPDARNAAQAYAAANPFREVSAGTGSFIRSPALTWSDANSVATDDIVLGHWDHTKPDGIGVNMRFNPTLDPTQVNAVFCQYRAPLPTTFLRLIGIGSLNAYARAIAVTYPPLNPPPGCLFPIAVCDGAFQDGTAGCGTTLKFINSSGNNDPNTAAWANIAASGDPNAGQNPNKPIIENQINAANSGGTCNFPTQGSTVPVNNGEIDPAIKLTRDLFIPHYQSETHEVKNAENEVVYSGGGWKVNIPIIGCGPGGPINGTPEIQGWTTLVITQVIYHGDCAVQNGWNGGDTTWGTACAAEKNPAEMNEIHGYFACEIFPAPPAPGPVGALATRLRLVK